MCAICHVRWTQCVQTLNSLKLWMSHCRYDRCAMISIKSQPIMRTVSKSLIEIWALWEPVNKVRRRFTDLVLLSAFVEDCASLNNLLSQIYRLKISAKIFHRDFMRWSVFNDEWQTVSILQAAVNTDLISMRSLLCVLYNFFCIVAQCVDMILKLNVEWLMSLWNFKQLRYNIHHSLLLQITDSFSDLSCWQAVNDTAINSDPLMQWLVKIVSNDRWE
jgi:hypothetical protein